MKILIPSLLLILATWHPVSSETLTDSCVTDIMKYEFLINISDESDSIEAEARITLIALAPLHSFTLDLENTQSNGKGMKVKTIRRDGMLLRFTQVSNLLRIQDLADIRINDTLVYEIQYSGIPSDGLIISKNRYGRRTFFADNWPERAKCWIPCNDFPADKAKVTFSIVAPSHYRVVANGLLTGIRTVRPGFTQWKWVEDVPISTKVMVFGAADFSVTTDSISAGFNVETWVYKENEANGFLDYSPAKEIVDTFIHLIGKYPFEKLANVQSTTIYGGMENASCIFYSEYSVNGKCKAHSLLAHEIAHQWFGNSVTECNWSNLWLSEGFATFFANIYFEKKYGRDTLKSRLIKERLEVFNWPPASTIAIVPDIVKNPRSLLNPVSYEKAGWVLHMLRMELGDESFFTGIRKFYSVYADKIASTEEFRKTMEEVSGKNLKEFFNQWLVRQGYPELEINWHYNVEQKKIQFSILQLQKENYTFSLEIIVSGSDKLFKLPIADKSTAFSFRLESPPKSILVDPGTKIFAKFKIVNN